MAGKRNATSELNHDNWEEYEPEEAGSFKRASDDVLRGRVIKTAKRRNPISSDNENKTKNVFSSFGGFGKTTTTTNQGPATAFAFLSNNTANNTNGLSSTTSISSSTTPANSNSMFKMPTNNTVNSSTIGTEAKKTEKPASYYAKLKGLNESVSQWIKTHVDKNPFCILSPIFKDYEKYLAEIDSEKGDATEKNSKSDTVDSKLSNEPKTTQTTSHTSSIFGNSMSKTNENPFLTKPVISEEKPKENNTNTVSSTVSTSTFSFGNASNTTTASTVGFSFGSGTPFTFTNVAKPPTEEKKSEDKEEEDEPPKVEFKPVVEDGSIFSKRCKVFVKKDGAFGDRGVGQLFLKPVAGSEKIQLIVRADTNLGNLLLNFILSDGIPIQRTGKNNVMLVCIPTPEAKPPPTPILLRVKTAEEADEMLKVLEKHKK